MTVGYIKISGSSVLSFHEWPFVPEVEVVLYTQFGCELGMLIGARCSSFTMVFKSIQKMSGVCFNKAQRLEHSAHFLP